MAVWRDGGRPAASPLLGSPSDFFHYLDFLGGRRGQRSRGVVRVDQPAV